MGTFFKFDRLPMHKCVALTLGLLMVAIGCVQAVHVHDALARQSSPASHCSLCVVAHNAAVITPVSNAPAPVIEAYRSDAAQRQVVLAPQVLTSFIRPPPYSL
jgi:hypothetical protein